MTSDRSPTLEIQAVNIIYIHKNISTLVNMIPARIRLKKEKKKHKIQLNQTDIVYMSNTFYKCKYDYMVSQKYLVQKCLFNSCDERKYHRYA